MNAPKVDVVTVLGDFLRLGREIVPHWNTPRGTGSVANRARFIAGLRTPTTATVLRALVNAEREGLVECVGTGAEHNRAWNKSASAERERYWKLTPAALARIGGAA